MQSYINYLLEDICKACRPQESVSPTATTQTFEEHIAEVEAWLENKPEKTFGSYCGLDRTQFPPAEQLTSPQMESVCKAFKDLLFSWNLGADIPEKVPLAKTYSLLIGILDKEILIVTSGFYYFDFCTGNDEGCELGEYCPCKTFDERHPGLFKNDLRGAT